MLLNRWRAREKKLTDRRHLSTHRSISRPLPFRRLAIDPATFIGRAVRHPHCAFHTSYTEFLLAFTAFYWLSPSFTEFYRAEPAITGFYLVLSGFTGCYWVLPSFTGCLPCFTDFHRFVPSFTGFHKVSPAIIAFYSFQAVMTGCYWVLLSFTEFDWVFLGSIGLNRVLRVITRFLLDST